MTTHQRLVAEILKEMDRVGFDPDHPPDLQPSLIPVADKWLRRWASLLAESPQSAIGPLASLLATAIHEARSLTR
jgi:hypothetical protein